MVITQSHKLCLKLAILSLIIGLAIVGFSHFIFRNTPIVYYAVSLPGMMIAFLATYFYSQHLFIKVVIESDKPWLGVLKHRPSIILIAGYAVITLNSVIMYIRFILLSVLNVGQGYLDISSSQVIYNSIPVEMVFMCLITLGGLDAWREWNVGVMRKRKKSNKEK